MNRRTWLGAMAGAPGPLGPHVLPRRVRRLGLERRQPGLGPANHFQVTWAQESSLYGGFVHPWSTAQPNGLHLMVSTWKRQPNGQSFAYHMSQYLGTV